MSRVQTDGVQVVHRRHKGVHVVFRLGERLASRAVAVDAVARLEPGDSFPGLGYSADGHVADELTYQAT